MYDFLSAINQILDGLGVDPKLGATLIKIIEFFVTDLPGYLEQAAGWIGGLGA
ncbi:MAG: hypothetical protein LBC83_06465 [Oscillospiraceae bacterium]|jgi:hypothetical protein|nr:hypothetical protein [Oscillospiraceae bacterium]